MSDAGKVVSLQDRIVQFLDANSAPSADPVWWAARGLLEECLVVIAANSDNLAALRRCAAVTQVPPGKVTPSDVANHVEACFRSLGAWADVRVFLEACCSDPDDRMYRAKDKTWWRRDDIRWVAVNAPPAFRDDLREHVVSAYQEAVDASVAGEKSAVDGLARVRGRLAEVVRMMALGRI